MLTAAATRLSPFALRMAGGGCFPAAERARVLWMGLDESGDPSGDSLARFARRSRAIANQIGGAPDGRRFHPHLSVARLRRPSEVTRWLRILDTYSGEPWTVDAFELVASHLGEGPGGRPRYETVARLPLGV